MTHSSPATEVLVDFQCRDCCFKAAGTYADVEIARRAHRHPNLSLVAMDRAERGRLWTKYFEKSLSPLLEDTARLPQPYPRSHIWGATLAALIVTAGGALFSRWLVDTRYPTMGGWIHGSFMLLIVGGLLYTLLRYENDRRAANIRRFRVVAECNHHIRNAVQVLLFTHDGRIQQESLGMSRQIADAVHRIELTAKPQRKPCQTLTIAKLPIPPTTPQVSRQVEPEGNRQRPPAHYGQLFVRQRARGRGRQSSRGRVCAALA